VGCPRHAHPATIRTVIGNYDRRGRSGVAADSEWYRYETENVRCMTAVCRDEEIPPRVRHRRAKLGCCTGVGA
jgi:hypothetical protein